MTFTSFIHVFFFFFIIIILVMLRFVLFFFCMFFQLPLHYFNTLLSFLFISISILVYGVKTTVKVCLFRRSMTMRFMVALNYFQWICINFWCVRCRLFRSFFMYKNLSLILNFESQNKLKVVKHPWHSIYNI